MNKSAIFGSHASINVLASPGQVAVGGLAGLLSNGSITASVASAPSMAGASGKTDVHRIAGNLATATLSGNLARGDMHLTTTPVNDPNGQDGQSTTLSSLQQQPTYEVLGWSFGNSDAAP